MSPTVTCVLLDQRVLALALALVVIELLLGGEMLPIERLLLRGHARRTGRSAPWVIAYPNARALERDPRRAVWRGGDVALARETGRTGSGRRMVPLGGFF